VAIVKGTRPRPRVALVGKFDPQTMENLTRLFPTYWVGEGFSDLEVNPVELDLVIIGYDIDQHPPVWLNGVYIICFSPEIPYLPSPTNDLIIRCPATTSTESYVLPEVSLNFERLREVDLANVSTTKGWRLIGVDSLRGTPVRVGSCEKASEMILENALIVDPCTNRPFATIFRRDSTGLGVAFFPNQSFRVFPWVELICAEWGKTDKDRFPNFGDWTKHPQWMITDEVVLSEQIDVLHTEKKELASKYDIEIGKLQETLLEMSAAANNGIRRLITSQGDDLVDEVGLAFIRLGFNVIKMDDHVKDGSPKLEDLRIDDPDIEDWQAIVEVRGYSKSGGKTDDISRLARFARHYEVETGKSPHKRIYVVNGQTDLPPSQRQAPLISSPEDVNEFSEQNGLIVWSLDLFKFLKLVKTDDDKVVARKSIRDGLGRWSSDLLLE
jgi:hypothetical protein